MIRKLILYKEGIETLIFFSKKLGEAFERMGYEVFYFDQESEYDSFLRLMEFIEPGVTAAVAFNFNGCSGEDYLYDKNGEHYYDFRGVPTVNIVVDHPFYYHKFEPYLPERYIQLSIDGEHEDYMKRFFPEIRRGPMLMLAGTPVCGDRFDDGAEGERIPSREERPLDVVFTGNYNPPEKNEPVLQRNGPEYAAFYHDLIDDFIAHPDSELTETIERHIRDSFDDVTEEDLKNTFPYMIVIDLYIRHYFRGEVVKTLVDGGVPVHVYGAGWEQLPVKNRELLITHPNTDSLTCLQRISEAAVSLNVMPWFKRGAHDRVFNSMLNGAVCVTDPSGYLEQELNDGEDCLFYRLDDLGSLPDKVSGILTDRDRWERIRRAAFEKAAAGHTWSHRAEQLDREVLRKL